MLIILLVLGRLIWTIVGHGPLALAVGGGRACFDIFFSRLYFLFSFSLTNKIN